MIPDFKEISDHFDKESDWMPRLVEHAPTRLPVSYADRLLAVAALIEGEIRTYEEGFAIRNGDGSVKFDKEYSYVEARVIRLRSASEFLRKLSTHRSVKGTASTIDAGDSVPLRTGPKSECEVVP